MKSRSIFSLLLMLLLTVTAASAQSSASDKIRPQWLHKLPRPTNSSFMYDFVSSSAPSLKKAQENCLANIISSSGLSQGVIIYSDYKSSEKLSQKWNNGKLTETVDYDSETKTSAKSKENELFVNIIDEYWTRDAAGTYFLTTLYAKSELGSAPLFDNVYKTTKYGAQGLWRSAIIPGWGQLYKGSNLKGGLIIGGTVALVGGIIYTETMRQDYMNKINKTHNTDNIRTYKTRADNFAMGRNICIGGLAALYIYNIIDAIVAPGARRIVVHQRKSGSSYAILPTISADGNPAVMASVTF